MAAPKLASIGITEGYYDDSDAPPNAEENGVTLEAWLKTLTPEIRDEMAASAFFAEGGNARRALRRLGFKSHVFKKDFAGLVSSIFGTPGCIAILSRTVKEVDSDEVRKGIMERLAHVAIHGEDRTAVRAAEVFAKIQSWIKPANININKNEHHENHLNLYAVLSTIRSESQAVNALPPGEVDSEEFLNHEPGDPIAVNIDNDDALRMAFTEEED